MFICKNDTEQWRGEIKYIKNYGSHYEMCIESRSSLVVQFGETSAGNFLCVPAFGVGSELAGLSDRFWNSEHLIRVLGEIDGITVSEALYEVSKMI